MFLAPLNYDRFFKKVFSEPGIAKAFLEDFLDIDIEEIEKLENKHRFTDDAALVEFDYRCKIEGNFVIIDMQQWYKRDVGQRFYLYHALNTGLQLEHLPQKLITKTPSIKVKDYHALSPVITIIWMATDSLNYKENYVSFCMTPEIVLWFIKDERLWRNPDIVELLESRSRVIDVLDNKEKGMGFIPMNRLIFVLQPNIVKDQNHPRYQRWFTFAEKSMNDENKEEDFDEYKNDEVFKEIIRRLDHRVLKPEDVQYIEDEKKLWVEFNRLEQGIFEEGIEVGYDRGKKNGKKEGIIEGKKEGIIEGKKEMARALKEKGIDISMIAEISGLTLEEIREL